MGTRLIIVISLLSLPAFAQSEVIYTGTPIDSGNIADGGADVCANAFDGDMTTFWAGAPAGQWCGYDLGEAVTITAIIITPRPDGSFAALWDRGAGQNVVEASNDPTFATGTVLLDTLAFQPYISQFKSNRRPVSPGEAYRYYRVRSPVGFGDVAEFRVIGPPVDTSPNPLNAQPVEPSVFPWGGAYLSGSTSVTMGSTTASAAIHYTINGSTPTCSSTLYSGLFTLTVGSATVVKAVACDVSFGTPTSTVSVAHFRNYGWTPGDSWYDVNTGDKIEGFSANIILAPPLHGHAPIYFMAGQWNLMGSIGANTYAAKSPGVWLYSSDDLYNWKLESQILDNAGADYGVNRAKILFSAGTNQYVLWAHCSDVGFSINRACIATTSVGASIKGPWTWVITGLDPDGHGYKDCTLFQEADGTAYTAYTDSTQTTIRVQKLSSDYLGVDGTSIIACSSCNTTTSGFGGTESPVLFRRGSTYFMILGASTFYVPHMDTNPEYITATSPMGTWSSASELFATNQTLTSYNGQPASVFQVPSKTDAYVYVSDWWNHPSEPDPGSTHQFLPLTFADATHVQAVTPATWDLSRWADAFTTLAVTPGSLSFACVSGRGSSSGQTVNIGVSQGTLDQWTGGLGSAWASISPTSGITVATPTVVADCTALATGSYSDTLSISSTTTGMTNSPQTVALSVLVSAPVSLINLGNGSHGNGTIH